MLQELTQNWSGHHTFQATDIYYPETVEAIQAIVRRSSKVKVVGTGHSFNHIADSTEAMISLERLEPLMEIDAAAGTVTISGGVRYGDLGPYLHSQGYSLQNLASLPHITVAGACATATHGSGDNHGCLTTAITAMEIVTGTGDVITLARETDGERFNGAAVGLGGTGVITRLTLEIRPTFDMRQDIYQNLPLSEMEAHFDEIHGAGYSVSFFTNWIGDAVHQVWVKRTSADDDEYAPTPNWFGAMLAVEDMTPAGSTKSIGGLTPQMGLRGPWHERMPHFRYDYDMVGGDELQTEYFVPREHGAAACLALNQISQQLAPTLKVSEVRTVAGDALWMSPFYRGAGVGLHISWFNQWDEVQKRLPLVEEALAPFDPIPHWGKLFTMSPAQVQSRYERLDDFRALLEELDPEGKFRNPYLDTYIFG